MPHEVLALMTGKVDRTFSPREGSAIGKEARQGPVAVGPLGFEGDEQADLVHHGGADKAVHHYPAEHYYDWIAELGAHPLLEAMGAFGENISTEGLAESEVCIGDRFRLGTALVEVSQGRQPCWKISHRFGVAWLTARVVETRRSGWYYRVIEPGVVAAGDTIALEHRPLPQWSVERTFGLLIAGDGKNDPAALRALAGLDVLAEPWRQRAQALLA